MSNNLKQAKKDLKAFAKRAKHVKYTESLLFSYLITGMITFSIGINTSSDVLYERMSKELVMSAEKTRTAIKKKKKANKESIEDLNLELIQLMEQGDQVIKSKWDSWQFGSNTFASRNNGAYKGRGDKASKYPFVGVYNRGNWGETAALSNRRRVLNPAINSSSVGSTSYGLASLLHVQEPEVEIQIMANVRPKSVLKEEITITPQIDMPREVVRPAINLGVTTPIAAPTILLPTLNPVAIEVAKIDEPGAPSKVDPINITMKLDAPQITLKITPPSLTMAISAPEAEVNTITITPPGVSEVSTITVNKPAAPSVTPPSPTVNPIVFSIPNLKPYGNNQYQSRNQNKNLEAKIYTLSVQDDPQRGDASIVEYITNTGEFTAPSGTVMNVDVKRRRAVTLDPGLPTKQKPGIEEWGGIDDPNYSFENFGRINLIVEDTAGIEVQPDTHKGNLKVKGINSGIIEGKADKQAAMLFTSENSTSKNEHTLINKGNIIMGGKNSVGFATSDFIVENNNKASWHMIAKNEGIIDLNNEKNHGMVVAKTQIPIGSNSSFENSGTINVNGKESGGITLLDKIPTATNTGTINITGKNSFGLYSEVDSKIKNAGNINIKDGATGSMGIRVGSTTATNMSNEGGTITISSKDGNNMGVYSEDAPFDNKGAIKVEGKNGNIGMYFNGTTGGTNKNQGAITVTGENGYGVMLNNGSIFENHDSIVATGTDAMGMYMKNSTATNKQNKTISSTKHHAVVQDGGTFTNE